jgi:hypothetical protein
LEFFRLSPVRARPQMVCENADEHPALPPEHCTLVSHVKAGDAKRIDFSMLLAEDKPKPHCGFKHVAAAYAASRRENRVNCLVLRMLKPVALSRDHGDRDMKKTGVTL